MWLYFTERRDVCFGSLKQQNFSNFLVLKFETLCVFRVCENVKFYARHCLLFVLIANSQLPTKQLHKKRRLTIMTVYYLLFYNDSLLFTINYNDSLLFTIL